MTQAKRTREIVPLVYTRKKNAEGVVEGEVEDDWASVDDEIEELEEFSEEEVHDADEDDLDEEDMDEEEVDEENAPKDIYRPNMGMEDGEELTFDSSAYDMLHMVPTGWPCLSFDIIKDTLGNDRTTYPHTAYVVAGTQAPTPKENELKVMKWTRLHKTKRDGYDSEVEDIPSDAEDENYDLTAEEDAVLIQCTIPLQGNVNRLSLMPQMNSICALWSDFGGHNSNAVHFFDLSQEIESLDKENPLLNKTLQSSLLPIQSFYDAQAEGFALRFSPHTTGLLLTGNTHGEISIFSPCESGWSVDNTSLRNHTGASVEDISFHAIDPSLFATACADGSFKLFDIRQHKHVAELSKAHSGSDVNVLEWSPTASKEMRSSAYHLLTGGDDGSFKVWDCRKLEKKKNASCLVNLAYHQNAISSVAWSRHDPATLCTSSYDGEVCVWDLSVEYDVSVNNNADFPPQLMFQHVQQDPKEVKWHPQIPYTVLSTGSTGFHVFKPSNLKY